MPDQPRTKRRWRNFLLDARSQLRLTMPMVFFAAALFVGLGLIAVQKAESATKIGINQIELSAPFLPDPDQIRASLLQREALIFWAVVLTGALLCGGLILVGIVLTHRIAGPLYRIDQELGQLRDGCLAEIRPLRKGDQLVALHEQLGRAAIALRQREQRDVAVLRRIVATGRADPRISDEALSPLETRLQDKEASLG